MSDHLIVFIVNENYCQKTITWRLQDLLIPVKRHFLLIGAELRNFMGIPENHIPCTESYDFRHIPTIKHHSSAHILCQNCIASQRDYIDDLLQFLQVLLPLDQVLHSE